MTGNAAFPSRIASSAANLQMLPDHVLIPRTRYRSSTKSLGCASRNLIHHSRDLRLFFTRSHSCVVHRHTSTIQ